MKFTEDVKETLHRAVKLATARAPRAGDATAGDLDIVQAALEGRRPFSKLDVLLREMRIAPRALRDQLRAARQTANDATSQTPPATEEAGSPYPAPLRPFIARLAAQGRDTADMNALIETCANAADPHAREILSQAGLRPEAVQAALAAIRGRRVLGVDASRWWSALYLAREIAELLLIVLVFLILIREGLGEPRLIPSPSMLPTLQVGDRVIVEKLTRWARPYQRGDILVFYPPEPEAIIARDPFNALMRMSGFSALLHNKPDDPVDRAFIKRLIGLPGETLQVVPGAGVRINGRLLDEPYVAERPDLCVNACRGIVLPPGQYFMMGDNRNDSKDSRFFGFQPASRVVGRAVFRIWPLNRIGPL